MLADVALSLRHVALPLATALALAACSSDEGAPAFTQADLAGEWRYTIVFAGPSVSTGSAAGWARGTLTVDAAGAATVQTFQDSTGTTVPPALPSIVYAISGDGVVTATTTLFSGAYGKMSLDKRLFVTTATQGTGGSARARLAFYQKVVPGVTYGAPDAASASFEAHQLGYGATPGWLHARVVAGPDRVYSLIGVETSAGPLPDVPDQGTLSVSGAGVVTSTAAPSFAGYLSADKELVIGTQTNGPGDHALTVLVRSGSGFATADLAGGWAYSQFAVTADLAGWTHGSVSFDAAGAGTFGVATDSLGGSETPPATTLAVSASGIVTTVPASDFHGALGSGRDFMVATETLDLGVYGVIVALR